jgi:hypothetical protein
LFISYKRPPVKRRFHSKLKEVISLTYRELLKKCKEEPGCIGTKEQSDLDSKIRYMDWADKLDAELETKDDKL